MFIRAIVLNTSLWYKTSHKHRNDTLIALSLDIIAVSIPNNQATYD